eukprot:TRINITY_DN3513_c0_g2_i1.p1 TRINITY_DN3513_c0_g2~~TRINITY_DN3513_c0_g2_i1.p1  ORF type:complete len:280 (+),score=43.08 TRINITY_DN3513_c0_g2_i1:110-949(+)
MVHLNPQKTEELVPELRSMLVEQRKLSPEEERFCDDSCLRRYLRARRNDKDKALEKLTYSLDWRQDFGVTSLTPNMFKKVIDEGQLYLWPKLVNNRCVIMSRKRTEKIKEEEMDLYLKFLVFMLESAIKMLPAGQEKAILIIDMNNYSRQNSPPLSYSLQVLRIFSGHYPERLHKFYLVDAPAIFSLLYTAVYPFIDPVTKEKINFVYSDKYLKGAVTEKNDPKQFLRLVEAYKTPFDKTQFQFLTQLWGIKKQAISEQNGNVVGEKEFFEAGDGAGQK